MSLMNIRNRDVVKCFPLLASILGDRYGVKIHIGGEDAKTDGKTIYLPSMPEDIDQEMLETARGYVDHEAAHIRHTDFEQLKAARLNKLECWLFNAIEDWRVEKKICELYPGCEHNLRKLIIRHFGMEAETGHKNPVSAFSGYVLLTVRSWVVPEIKSIQMAAGQNLLAICPELKKGIDSILNEIADECSTTMQGIEYARKLAQLIVDQFLKPDAKTKTKEPGSKGKSASTSKTQEKESSKNNDSVNNGRDAKANENSSTSAAQSPRIQEGKGSTCKSSSESRADCTEIPASQLSELEKELPQNLGEILADKLQTGISPTIKKEGIAVAKIGKKELKPFAHDERIEALRASVAMRQRVSGLLMAQKRMQGGLGRKGKLESSCLHRICVGNGRVFRGKEEKQGINTALHILVDCSSSMYGQSIMVARKACLALVTALSGIRGVNLALTAFPSEDIESSVTPLIRHGERRAQLPSFRAYGNTPLGPALWWTLTNMVSLKEERKIILIISDGMPTSVKAARNAIFQCRKFGLELVGIGICTSAMIELLGEASRAIWKLEQLAPAMFELLQKTLLKGELK